MEGWAKIKVASKYAGVSERTMRNWIKEGLEHSRLPTGSILIQYQAIDDFLRGFGRSVRDNSVDMIVDGVCREFQ